MFCLVFRHSLEKKETEEFLNLIKYNHNVCKMEDVKLHERELS